MSELLLEMSRVGMIDGWAIDIYSGDHNPPHFHFGPIRVCIPTVAPKNVTEMRTYVFKNDQAKVSDKQLAKLVTMLQGKTSFGIDMIPFMRQLWKSFDDLRPKNNTLNEDEEETIGELLEIAGCNK